MPKFLPSGKFKCIDPKDFDLNKYNKNSVLEVEFSRLILNIQNNDKNCILIILWFQIKKKSKNKSCLNVN